MFLDEAGWGRAPEPEPERPAMTPRQERILLRLILCNVLFLLVAPIGGATVIEGVWALVRAWR